MHQGGLGIPTDKKRCSISADQVPIVFSNEKIRDLLETCELGDAACFRRFAKCVRLAAHHYSQAALLPTINELHDEIEILHGAASRGKCEEVANRIENISRTAWELLSERGARPSVSLKLPSPQDLLHPEHRHAAIRSVVTLCTAGGGWVEDRRIASGRRWQPLLYAPKRSPNFPKREAERDFVWHLQSACHAATGHLPPRTAHRTNPGPFARMAQECLALVGANHASAVDLINELNSRALNWEKRRARRLNDGSR